MAHNTDCQGIDKGVCLVAGVKFGLAANIGQPQRVAVAANTRNHTADHAGGIRVVDSAETQRIHNRDRACTHRNNVTHNTAHAGCRTLIRLNIGGVVV